MPFRPTSATCRSPDSSTPRILIPEWLFARLTPGELNQIVLHEHEHLRRCDDWTNLLQKVTLVLFPLNPALYWVDRKMSLEREMACDEGVIRQTNSPREYALCLTNLAERSLQQRSGAFGMLSLGIWQRRPELANRIYSILSNRPRLTPMAASCLLAVLTVGLALSSLELARSPQLVTFVETPVTGSIGSSTGFDQLNQDSAFTGRAIRTNYTLPQRDSVPALLPGNRVFKAAIAMSHRDSKSRGASGTRVISGQNSTLPGLKANQN